MSGPWCGVRGAPFGACCGDQQGRSGSWNHVSCLLSCPLACCLREDPSPSRAHLHSRIHARGSWFSILPRVDGPGMRRPPSPLLFRLRPPIRDGRWFNTLGQGRFVLRLLLCAINGLCASTLGVRWSGSFSRGNACQEWCSGVCWLHPKQVPVVSLVVDRSGGFTVGSMKPSSAYSARASASSCAYTCAVGGLGPCGRRAGGVS